MAAGGRRAEAQGEACILTTSGAGPGKGIDFCCEEHGKEDRRLGKC